MSGFCEFVGAVVLFLGGVLLGLAAVWWLIELIITHCKAISAFHDYLWHRGRYKKWLAKGKP